MQLIPKGSFIMGSTKAEKGHFGDEGPQHKVNIDGFWMSQREITWDLYNFFVTREMDANQKPKTNQSEVQLDVDAVSGATTPYVEMSFGIVRINIKKLVQKKQTLGDYMICMVMLRNGL